METITVYPIDELKNSFHPHGERGALRASFSAVGSDFKLPDYFERNEGVISFGKFFAVNIRLRATSTQAWLHMSKALESWPDTRL